MMNKIIILFIIVLLGSCNRNSLLVIQGSVPSNKYDGAVIYLVPFENPSKETVDSTYIENGSFTFSAPVNSPEIRVLRMRSLLRFYMQGLLLVAEPGKLLVHMDSISSASGTKQNDLLQQWKEKKEDINKRMGNLQNAMQGRELREQEIIKQNIQLIQAEYRDYNFEFIKKYRNTIIGQFVYETMKNSLSPEQQDSLKEMSIDK